MTARPAAPMAPTAVIAALRGGSLRGDSLRGDSLRGSTLRGGALRRRALLPWVALWVWCCGGLLVAAAPARADAEQSFKQGIEAMDLEHWPEAVEHFRAALVLDPQESDRRIFISGAFSKPYLPHFYLGWTLYRAQDGRCEEALASWRTSLQHEVVQNFRRQYQDLQKGQEVCRGRLLPAAVAETGAILDRGRDLLAALQGDRDAIVERQAVSGLLATAEAQWMASRKEGDLAGVRRAATQGQAAVQRLEAWQRDAEQRTAQDLELSAAGARQALGRAEDAERSLLNLMADAGFAEARRQLPDGGLPSSVRDRLETVRRDAAAASSLPEHRAVRREAEALAEELDGLHRRLLSLGNGSAGSPPTAPEGATSRPSLAVTADDDVKPSAVSSPAAGSPDIAPRAEEAEARPSGNADTGDGPPPSIAEAAAWRRTAAELLAWADGEERLSPLTSIQVDRLRAALLATDPDLAAPSQRRRLEASHGALQLLAAGQLVLRGEPGESLRLLDLRPLPPSWAAHGHLFRAAARFILYRRGGEQDAALLRAARQDVVRCRLLDADLVPERRTFSPAFRAFFVSVDPS